tara:strand:- start:10715 stop:12226 length:1512 start_codon:yes stop_codon:yes gene_type:complete
MAILTTGNTFANGDQVTAATLNSAVNDAEFAAGAVDGTSTQLSGTSPQQIIVKDAGISTGKIATGAVTTDKINAGAVTTAKIADSNVTKAKIEDFTNLTVLGNVSGSAATPAEVTILDEDNMASDSATSLATQQSIKAYADSKVDGTGAGSFTTLAASGDVTFDTTTLKVDSSNNRVGILNASPTVPLDVNGNARVVGTFFVGTDDTDPNGLVDVYGGGTGQDEGGEIKLRTAADFDSTYNHYFIDAHQDDFRIGREGNTDIVLSSAGNVGIGTASPIYLLDVSPTSNGGEIARFKSDTTNAAADVLIVDQDNSNTRAALQVQGNAGSTECLFVGSNGNVGINTVDPDFLLDINDDAATGAGIRVTGGGGGGPLAQFVRDVSSSGSITINIAGGDPQFQLTSSGSDVFAIGVDENENTFQICAGSAVGSNQVLVAGTNGKVGIGETVPSAPLTVTSTAGGVLLPRMTTTQMNAISSPANGEIIYNTTASKFYGYAGGAWVALH